MKSTLYILFLLGILGFISPVLAAEKGTPYKITRIRGQLFYNESGQFSENVIDNKNFTFWNEVTRSNSTWITVELSGEPEAYHPNRKISIQAIEDGGKILARKSEDTAIFNEQGKYYVPFLIDGTGCAPLRIEVKITGQPKPVSLRKIIPFNCGE